MNQGCWRGVGGGGGPSWLHKGNLTIKGTATKQTFTVYWIGVNKISPYFDTLFVTPLYVIWKIYRAYCVMPVWVIWQQEVNEFVPSWHIPQYSRNGSVSS
jgi:hypothetical protein